MRLTKRQLRRIIREEKQQLMTEMLDMGKPAVKELLMNLLDAMIKSEVEPYYWQRMLESMQKMGPEKALQVFDAAIYAYENDEDPNDYA